VLIQSSFCSDKVARAWS